MLNTEIQELKKTVFAMGENTSCFVFAELRQDGSINYLVQGGLKDAVFLNHELARKTTTLLELWEKQAKESG